MTLLGIADAIRPSKGGTLSQPCQGFEKFLHFAAAEGRQREVALGLEIRVRRAFARATNGWALTAVLLHVCVRTISLLHYVPLANLLYAPQATSRTMQY